MLTHQIFELNGKRYDVGILDNRIATIRVETKRGWRTLGGYGRAFRKKEWNAVREAVEGRIGCGGGPDYPPSEFSAYPHQ